MLIHTTTRKHWTIDSEGAHCPTCGAGRTKPCFKANWNVVHLERVHQAGHRTKIDELPIHRAKVPSGALAELRKRMSK